MAIKLMDNAKNQKIDEFYTRLEDIEKELKYYKKFFKDKVILCNCDDPYESNFFKYFALNFNNFGLKKLICTCYDGSPFSGDQLSIFDVENVKPDKEKQAYKVELEEVIDFNNDGTIDLSDVEELLKKNGVVTLLEGNGDFKSSECIELLKQSDIVATNPPFSLFREYLAQLIEYDKKFIIIGNTNALTYKEVFKLFKEDKVRTGNTNFNVGMLFKVPDSFTKYKTIIDGVKYARVSTSCWFTNLPVKKHTEDLTLTKLYKGHEEEYPFYENYDAINVDAYNNIPADYFECIGAPITFLDKINPAQFSIVALGIVGSIDFKHEKKMEILDKEGNPTGKYTINAKGTLYRKHLSTDKKPPAFKDCETGELYQSIYARVIVRRTEGNDEDNTNTDKN